MSSLSSPTRSRTGDSEHKGGYGGQAGEKKDKKEKVVDQERMDKKAAKFFARSKDVNEERKAQKERVDRTLNSMRQSFQEAARSAEPAELRRMMLEWTTADFEPHTILGKGGFGTVHLVRCLCNDRFYALKRMSKAHYKKKNALAFNERNALAEMSTRWCTSLLCAFQDSRNLFMAMEFCQGGSLQTHIVRRGRLSLDETAFYMAELIEAVAEVHRFGHVHRDLKPDNMMLTSRGHLKLLDFGLSTVQDETGAAKCQMMCGTPEYMAPEAFEGYSSCKSDIWAIGIITFECLTGLLPFDLQGVSRHDKVDALAEQAMDMDEILPGMLKMARDRRLVVGTKAREFESARHFMIGVLRADDQERTSLAQCRREVFFDGLDFARLHEMRPPLAIQVTSPSDLTYFEVPDVEPEKLPPPHKITAWDPSLQWANFAMDAQLHRATKESTGGRKS